jgi:hypothetical protein
MANLDTRGFFPDTTPNPALGQMADTLQQAGRYKQEKEYRQQKEEEQDQYRKYNVLKDTIDPEDVATGNASADDYFTQETKRVFNEIISDPKVMKLPYAELYGLIQSKWQPVVQSAGKIKNGLAQIDATVKAAGTEDTNLATDKLAPAAKLNFINEIMPLDKDGTRKYNTSAFNPDKNHVIDILNSDDYWRYMKGADPLIKYIENHKTEDVSLQRNLKDQSIVPYTGKQSPFSALNIKPGEYGVITGATEPQFDIPTEDDFVTENGQQVPIKLLRKDIYEDHIESIPANKRSLDYLWNSYKDKNGIKSENATEEEKRKRAFAIGVFKAHDPSQMSRKTSQHLPRNTTNNYSNIGGGAKTITEIDLNEFPSESDGGKNITDITDGITFTDIAGKKLNAKKTVYYPSSKKVKVTEYVGKDNDGNPTGERTREFSLPTYIQIIKNKNPQTDVRNIEALGAKNSGGGVKPPTAEYSQITETYKGKIGVKNGKWYYTETGKPVE